MLEALKREVLGRGYLERVPGGRGLRDTRNDVDVVVIVTGGYPGDGKPKPVRFPDPGEVAVRGAEVALLPLAKLVELKLASGMSAPHRLRDLADVLELIRVPPGRRGTCSARARGIGAPRPHRRPFTRYRSERYCR